MFYCLKYLVYWHFMQDSISQTTKREKKVFSCIKPGLNLVQITGITL